MFSKRFVHTIKFIPQLNTTMGINDCNRLYYKLLCIVFLAILILKMSIFFRNILTVWVLPAILVYICTYIEVGGLRVETFSKGTK